MRGGTRQLLRGARYAGCIDQECCNLVCAADFFCCEEAAEGENAWDDLCVDRANELCVP